MANATIIGTQWGDEGKGKIVDWLSDRADIVVRFQGGHNAGHTLVVDGVTYKLSLLPSGIVRDNILSVIGNGVVIDLWALEREIQKLRAQSVSITPEKLLISETAPLILPLHGQLDATREADASKQGRAVGTTKRGIGPAYEDKVGRRALRVCDLFDSATLKHRLEFLFAHYQVENWTDHEGSKKSLDQLVAELRSKVALIEPFVGPAWKKLNDVYHAGKNILCEGAQGAWLDVDHGTYPFVTSSNTHAGQASLGSGLGPSKLGCVLGITKAYTTRVGEGPFPTELLGETGALIAKKGAELGTVTGRARRCGWFDAVLVRQSVKLSGMSGLALTKLDVLDGLEEIKICIGYELDGKKWDYLPPLTAAQKKLNPIYETIKGWGGTTQGARDFEDLPPEAASYLRRIEELCGVPIMLTSTSPKREDVIMSQNPFS